MSQHDMDLANAAGASFRADLNLALAALVSNSSGATAPATTFAYQFWADTTTGLLKQRNAANSAWITIGTLASANLGLLPASGGSMTGDLTMSGASIVEAEGASVASAATTNIWATDGNTIHITGSTGPITSFGTAPQAGAWMKVIFDSTPTLTHGANLNLPGSANIVAAADDFAFVYADTTTQFDVLYFKKNGTAVVDLERKYSMDSAAGAGSPGNTSENDLKTATVAGGTLLANGDMLSFRIGLRCASNSTTKRIRVYFGATAIIDSTAIANNGSIITLSGLIIRTSATTQVCYSTAIITTSNPAWSTAITGGVAFTAPSETLSGNIICKTTVTLGAGAAVNDVVQDYFLVSYIAI